MKDTHGNQWHLNLLPNRKREKDRQKKYHLTDTINNSANRRSLRQRSAGLSTASKYQ